MQQYVQKARVLIEALPYMKAFNGKIVVVKYGGSMMYDEELKAKMVEDIILMKYIGLKPIIIHGGGPDINKVMKQMGKEPEFIDGCRVTDQETMDIVEMVLCGRINKNLITGINRLGGKAVGLCGKDGNMVKATKKHGFKDGKEIDLGFVGEIQSIDPSLLFTLIEQDYIPVLAPVAVDAEGNSMNINGDYFASAIAGSLKAEKFVLLTDIDGVMKDGKVLHALDKAYAETLIESGVISGGMIPKVRCCLDAIALGVKRVHILDGRIEHSMLLEFFTRKGVGTMIKEADGDVDEYL